MRTQGTITVSKITNAANDDLNLAVYNVKDSLKFSLIQPNFLYFYDAAHVQAVMEAGYRSAKENKEITL